MNAMSALHWFHLFLHAVVFACAVVSIVRDGAVRWQYVVTATALLVVPAVAIGSGAWSLHDWLGERVTYATLMAWGGVALASERARARHATRAP